MSKRSPSYGVAWVSRIGIRSRLSWVGCLMACHSRTLSLHFVNGKGTPCIAVRCERCHRRSASTGRAERKLPTTVHASAEPPYLSTGHSDTTVRVEQNVAQNALEPHAKEIQKPYLRPTAATLLLQQGVHVKVVSE